MARDSRSTKDPVPFQPEEATPLETDSPTHGNILAMMAESGKPSEHPYLHGEAIEEDHAIAASLPVERSVVAQNGHMDHHRKPIISIHGKDVDEHELDHTEAA
jgi:hypothetical protein